MIIAILYDALHIFVNHDSYFATPYGWTIDLTTFRSIVNQLRRALELFADEVSSEGIDKRFDEDHYWGIFFLCDSEDSIMSENQASTTFIYDLQTKKNFI